MDFEKQDADRLLKKSLESLSFTEEDSEKKTQCMQCGALIDQGAKACPQCNTSLIRSCWNCGASVWTADKCTCGTFLDTKEIFYKRIESIDNLLKQEFCDFDAIIQDLKLIVGEYLKQDMEDKNAIPSALQALGGKIINKKAEEAAYTKKLHEIKNTIAVLVARNEIATALDILIKVNAKFSELSEDPSVAILKKRLSEINNREKVINELLLKKGEIDSEEQVLSLCREIKELACDYDVIPYAQHYLPKPVGEVIAKQEIDNIKLLWIPSPSQGIGYEIRRKKDQHITSKNDGEIIAKNVGGCEYTDRSIETGVVYYYAVFAVRLGAYSELVLSNPAAVYKPIFNQRQINASGAVVIKWQRPLNVKKISVLKFQDKAPRTDENYQIVEDFAATGIVNASLDGFRDDIVQEDQWYFYLIVCEYAGGKKAATVIRATQGFNLPQLTDLSWRRDFRGTFIKLTHKTYRRCVMSIYRSSEKLDLSTTDQFEEAELFEKFNLTPYENCTYNNDNTIDINANENELFYLYPVLKHLSSVIAGEGYCVNTKIPFNNVSCDIINGNVARICFDWAKDSTKVVALYSKTKHFEKMESISESKTVFRKENVGGVIEIDISKGHRFITLFALQREGKVEDYSLPYPIEVKPENAKSRVYYSIKAAKVFISQKIELNIDLTCKDNIELSNLVIVHQSKDAKIEVVKLEHLLLKSTKQGYRYLAKHDISSVANQYTETNFTLGTYKLIQAELNDQIQLIEV